MASSLVLKKSKQKRGCLSKGANKRRRKYGVTLKSSSALYSPKHIAVSFVSLDVNVMLKPLIQSLVFILN